MGVTADDVSQAVARADAKVQAGKLTATGSELLLEVSGEIEVLDRLRGIVIVENGDGSMTKLGEIAEVSRGHPQCQADRSGGRLHLERAHRRARRQRAGRAVP